MDLKGSKTEANLWEAIKGESVARNKYTFYAKQAQKDGYVEMSKIFEEIANNEKAHAKIWFKLLHDSKMPSTVQNIKDCIIGENYEHTSMYPEFARIAKEEGFDKIAGLFECVAKIESYHEKRYQQMLDSIQNNEVFKKSDNTEWECIHCGYHAYCKEAPLECPVCDHPRAYFKALECCE